MAFKVILSLSAEKELEDAIHYYSQINQVLPERFYNEFLELITLFEKQPYFEKKYDIIRTCKIRSFPYLIHFIVNEETDVVKLFPLFPESAAIIINYRLLDR